MMTFHHHVMPKTNGYHTLASEVVVVEGVEKRRAYQLAKFGAGMLMLAVETNEEELRELIDRRKKGA